MNEFISQQSKEGFGRDNAKNPCQVLYRPKDEAYSEKIRQFQGCPTVAVTGGGRVYLGWYSGGNKEPDIRNYNYLVYSDDGGKTFGDPLLVIPSSRERMVHALDIQLWIAPNGALWVFWVQNNVLPLAAENEEILKAKAEGLLPIVVHEGCLFPDMRHTEWCVVCEDPDAEDPVFSPPRMLDTGFLRCKPLVLDNGRWLFFNYDQLTDTYGYSISDDEGKTFTRHYGPKKIPTAFDETMAYQKRDGTVRAFARCFAKKIAEFTSSDRCESWSEAVLTDIDSPNTRFFIGRTPTGRILLVNNDSGEGRKRMSMWLSEDDGETFPYKKTLDDPDFWTTYPDVDYHDGKIYVAYDHERVGAKEIRLLICTEEDIMSTDTVLQSKIISKP